MKVIGIIPDIDDITQKSFANRDTGELVVSGSFLLQVTKPSQTITIKVNADLWKEADNGKKLESLVGNQAEFWIEQKEYSFARADGQTVSGSSNNLFRLPQQAQQK